MFTTPLNEVTIKFTDRTFFSVHYVHILKETEIDEYYILFDASLNEWFLTYIMKVPKHKSINISKGTFEELVYNIEKLNL